MRILFSTGAHYLPQRTGGSESSTDELCKALRALGHDCAVVSLLRTGDWTWAANRVRSKLSKRDFVADRQMGYPVYRGYDLELGVHSVVKHFKPDVAIVQAGQPFQMLGLLTREGLPCVFYARDVLFHLNSHPFVASPLIHTIANSHFTANRLNEEFGIRADIVPPYVEPANYIVQSSREEVMHVGLNPEKGIGLAFAIAELLPAIKFHFVESWSISDRIFEQLSARAAALGNVRLSRRSQDMRPAYSTAKLLLVPSQVPEAWGRVVTEAQLNGIPVLAAHVGGLPDSVGSGGLTIPTDRGPADWAAAIDRLCTDTAYYAQMCTAARMRTESEDVSATRLLSRLTSILQQHVTEVGARPHSAA